MNTLELSIALYRDYLDDFGLVKPHKADGTCNNGVMYSSVAQILTNSLIGEPAVRSCYLEPGLLNRKPSDNAAPQEQFDDYLGRAIRCIQSGNTTEPRQILWYGIKHFGFYNTDGKLEGKDFLWRFWFLFAFLFAGAFPALKSLVRLPLLWFLNSFKCDSISDTSGLQLEWLMTVGYDILFVEDMESYWKLKLWMNTQKTLSDVFSVYYTPDHPFTLFTKANLDV